MYAAEQVVKFWEVSFAKVEGAGVLRASGNDVMIIKKGER